MKQFFSLIKVLFKARYKFRLVAWGGRKGAAASPATKKDLTWLIWLLLAAAFLPMLAVLVSGVAQITPMFEKEGALAELMLFIYVITMLVIIVMGIINMLSYVYFNRDSEFLASLPAPNWKIFLAKLSVVYLAELGLSALSLIPFNLTIGIMTGQGFIFYSGTLLSILLVPALPMLLASIIAVPLMFIVSFFRKKGALTSIVIILLAGGIFAAYFYFYLKFMSMTDDDLNLDVFRNLIGGIRSWENTLYPVTALVKFCLLESVYGLSPALSALLNIGVVIVSFALAAFIAGFIANLVYHKSVIAQSVNSGAGGGAKAAEYKAAGVLASLMKKEWRALIREPAFAFQCIFGVIFAPIMASIISWLIASGRTDFAALNATGELAPYMNNIKANIPAMLLVFITVVFCSGMNIAACSAISREGKNFYITKIMPVPYAVQIKAKLYISLFISLAGSVITALSGTIILKLPAWQFAAILAFLCLYSYMFACFAVKFDLAKPRLNWSSPTEAVKNSRSATIPVLLNMAVGVLITGIMALFVVFNLIWPMWVILLAAAAGLAWLFHVNLFKNLDAAYESAEG